MSEETRLELTNLKETAQSLPEQVADQIQHLIAERQLAVGEKIPNEFELAQQLNVGRGTVREAVKLLIARNVLEIQRGRGTFVAQNPGRMADPLGFAFAPDKKQLAVDLCELRIILEPQIASLAAERATPAEVEEIRRCCEACDACIRAGADHTEEDVRFHEAIARAAHNHVIADVVPIIQQGVILFITVTHSDLVAMTMKTHHAVLDAIARGDANAAYAAMREHLVNNMNHIHSA